MRRGATILIVLGLAGAGGLAQELKPVPKDSIRASIPGCTKGAVFTVGRRTVDEPGSIDLPEGLHMHMNGPKKMMADIKAREGSMIEITGLVKRDDLAPIGVNMGGGISMTPGTPPSSGGPGGVPIPRQIQIDVESWRAIRGGCRTR